MSRPYRTPDRKGPEAHDPELERLVKAGADRRRGAASSAEREARNTLRHAIGLYRGSTRRRVAIVIAAVVAALAWALYLALVPEPFGKSNAMLNLPMWVTILAFIGAFIVSPYASEEAVAAEERWFASLPFTLEGHFAALSKPPRHSPTIQYELVWSGDRVPPRSMLLDLLTSISEHAKVVQLDDRGARLTDWVYTKKGRTSVSVVCPRIHDMIEKVLQPLHKSYPIERVSVTVPH